MEKSKQHVLIAKRNAKMKMAHGKNGALWLKSVVLGSIR